MTNQNNETPSNSLMNFLVDGLTKNPDFESESADSLWNRTSNFLDDLFLNILDIPSVLGTNPDGPIYWNEDFKDQKDVQNVSRDILLMANYMFGIQENPNFENSIKAYNEFNKVFPSSKPESEAKLLGAIQTVNKYLLTGKDHDKISENIKLVNKVSKEIINQDKLQLPTVEEKEIYFSRAQKIYSAFINLEKEGVDTYLTSGKHIHFDPVKSDEELYSMKLIDKHDVLENELADLYELMGEDIPEQAQTIIDSKIFLMYQGIIDKNTATKEELDQIVVDMPGLYKSIVSKAIKDPEIASTTIVNLAIIEGLNNYQSCAQIYSEESQKLIEQGKTPSVMYVQITKPNLN